MTLTGSREPPVTVSLARVDATGSLPPTPARWTLPRAFRLLAASLAVLVGVFAVAAGTIAVLVDRTQRDATGYLTAHPLPYATSTSALVFNSYRTGVGGDVLVPESMLGTIRIRTRSDRPIFVGIGPAQQVDTFLAKLEREIMPRLDVTKSTLVGDPKRRPSVLPTAKKFWVASSHGSGTQTLFWSPQEGGWRVVVMNANGSPEVSAEVTVGARFPDLLWEGIALLGGGIVLLVSGRTAISSCSAQRTRVTTRAASIQTSCAGRFPVIIRRLTARADE